jgi:hypothetical protein
MPAEKSPYAVKHYEAILTGLVVLSTTDPWLRISPTPHLVTVINCSALSSLSWMRMLDYSLDRSIGRLFMLPCRTRKDIVEGVGGGNASLSQRLVSPRDQGLNFARAETYTSTLGLDFRDNLLQCIHQGRQQLLLCLVLL